MKPFTITALIVIGATAISYLAHRVWDQDKDIPDCVTLITRTIDPNDCEITEKEIFRSSIGIGMECKDGIHKVLMRNSRDTHILKVEDYDILLTPLGECISESQVIYDTFHVHYPFTTTKS